MPKYTKWSKSVRINAKRKLRKQTKITKTRVEEITWDKTKQQKIYWIIQILSSENIANLGFQIWMKIKPIGI